MYCRLQKSTLNTVTSMTASADNQVLVPECHTYPVMYYALFSKAANHSSNMVDADRYGAHIFLTVIYCVCAMCSSLYAIKVAYSITTYRYSVNLLYIQ